MKLTLNIEPIPGMDIDLSVQPGDKGEGCAISLTMKASTEAVTTSPIAINVDEAESEIEEIQDETGEVEAPKPKRRITKRNSSAVRGSPDLVQPVQVPVARIVEPDVNQPEVIAQQPMTLAGVSVVTEVQPKIDPESLETVDTEEAPAKEPPADNTPAAKLSGIFKKPAQAPVPEALEKTNITSIVADLEAADQAPSDPEDEPEEEPAIQEEEEKPKLGGIFVKRKPSVIDAIEEESAPTEEEEQAPPPPRKPFSPFSKNRNA